MTVRRTVIDNMANGEPEDTVYLQKYICVTTFPVARASDEDGCCMNLKPLGDGLVVEPVEPEELVGHGILLPETARDKPMQGKVLAIGPGARNENGVRIGLDVSMGDVVLYAAYAGTEVKIEETKYLILKETDLLAIVQEP